MCIYVYYYNIYIYLKKVTAILYIKNDNAEASCPPQS